MQLDPWKVFKVSVITWGLVFILERMPGFRASLFPGNNHLV